MLNVASNESNFTVTKAYEMLHCEIRTLTVVNQHRRNSFSRKSIVDQHHRKAKPVNVVDKFWIDLPCDDNAIDVPFKEKTRNRFRFLKCLANCGQKYVVVVITRFEFGSQKDHCVKWFRLREMIVGDNETNIAAHP